MRPIAVEAGERAPDVDDLMEKAKNMEELLEKNERLMDNSQMKNITGVEEAPMTHYWTNQDQPSEGIESVPNRGGSSESVTFIDANPHQTGSALAAHENSAGGDADPSGGESSARYGAGSSGVIKANALQALLAATGKGGGPPPPGLGADSTGGDEMGGDEMGGDPMGGDAMGGGDDDPSVLAEHIKSLVDELAGKSGGGGMGGDEMGGDDMAAGPEDAPAGPM